MEPEGRTTSGSFLFLKLKFIFYEEFIPQVNQLLWGMFMFMLQKHASGCNRWALNLTLPLKVLNRRPVVFIRFDSESNEI